MNSNALIHTLTLAAAAKLIMAEFSHEYEPVLAMPEGPAMTFDEFAAQPHTQDLFTGTPGFHIGLKHPKEPEWIYIQVATHPHLPDLLEIKQEYGRVDDSTSISHASATVEAVASMVKSQFDDEVKQMADNAI